MSFETMCFFILCFSKCCKEFLVRQYKKTNTKNGAFRVSCSSRLTLSAKKKVCSYDACCTVNCVYIGNYNGINKVSLARIFLSRISLYLPCFTTHLACWLVFSNSKIFDQSRYSLNSYLSKLGWTWFAVVAFFQ